MSFTPDPALLRTLPGKTAIVTGGANGIGLEVVKQFHAHGARIVIADLTSSRQAAEKAIKSLGDDSRAIFIPVNITLWEDVRQLFATTIERLGRVDIVVANAGIMETRRFFDFEVDDKGELKDDGSSRVIDVNLRGTMNSRYRPISIPGGATNEI